MLKKMKSIYFWAAIGTIFLALVAARDLFFPKGDVDESGVSSRPTQHTEITTGQDVEQDERNKSDSILEDKNEARVEQSETLTSSEKSLNKMSRAEKEDHYRSKFDKIWWERYKEDPDPKLGTLYWEVSADGFLVLSREIIEKISSFKQKEYYMDLSVKSARFGCMGLSEYAFAQSSLLYAEEIALRERIEAAKKDASRKNNGPHPDCKDEF